MMVNKQEHPMDPGFYNMDCMEALKAFPDKFFDLAIIDPPYGGGYIAQSDSILPRRISGGGAADWQRRKRGRFGGVFDRYHIGNTDGRSMVQEVRPARGASSMPLIYRTGIYRPALSISVSWPAFPRIRSYGAATISIFRRRTAL